LTLTGTGVLSGGSAATVNGVANYSNLQVSAVGVGDTLAANITLNNTLSQTLVLSSTSSAFQVGQLTPAIMIANIPSSAVYGGSFTPTVTYGGDGTSSVVSNTTSICTVVSGVVNYVGVGTCSLTASATAGTYYAAAPGAAQTFPIGQATPSISFTSSLNPALTQNSVTLTASVSSPAGTPSGSVTFYNGTTALGTATLKSGTATLTTASLSVGTDSLSAAYSGDSNFAGVTSGTVAEVIEDFTLTIPGGGGSTGGGTQTVKAGQSATFTFAVSPMAPATKFPTAINFSVTGLPAGATYTLTPSSLAAGSSATTVTLVVNTTQTTASMEKPSGDPRLPRHVLPVALALPMFLSVGCMRQRRKNLRRIMFAAILLLAVSGAALLSGCGSSSPAPKNYTITVTATSGSLQHSTDFTLAMQ
jgi:hypothetical protein